MVKNVGSRLSEDKWFVYNILPLVFPYLTIIDIVRCTQVCKLWKEIAKEPTFWHSVTLDTCKISVDKMAKYLDEQNTVKLKLKNCTILLENHDILDMQEMRSLKVIEIDECSTRLLENLMANNPGLEVIRANIIAGATCQWTNFNSLLRMKNLYELKLHCDRDIGTPNFANLRHFYLSGNDNLENILLSDTSIFNNKLETLGLGNCTQLSSYKWALFFTQLRALKKLRLERCIDWDASIILKVIGGIKTLTILELLNITVPDTFADGLRRCTNIQELTIVPFAHRVLQKQAYFNTLVSSSVYQLSSTLKKFVFGFSSAYLNNTEQHCDKINHVYLLNDNSSYIIQSLAELKKVIETMVPQTEVQVIKFDKIGNIFT